MAPCRYYEICGLDADVDSRLQLCILHSTDSAKDQKAFDAALVQHVKEKGHDFRSFVFPGRVYYYDRSKTKFCDAKFKNATFIEIANFEGMQFDGKTDFSEVTFKSTVNFTDSTFSGAVDFEATIFGEDTSFGFTRFKDKASFFLQGSTSSLRLIAQTFSDKTISVAPVLKGARGSEVQTSRGQTALCFRQLLSSARRSFPQQ